MADDIYCMTLGGIANNVEIISFCMADDGWSPSGWKDLAHRQSASISRMEHERAVLLTGINELRLELDHWKRLAQESAESSPEAADTATPLGKARDTIENLLTGKLRGKIVDEVANAANRAKQDEAISRRLR